MSTLPSFIGIDFELLLLDIHIMVEHSSLRFRFDQFEKLPSQPGKLASSDEVTDCHRNVWSIDLYPGGQTKTSSSGEKSDITVFLFNRGERLVEGKVSFILRDSSGRAYCHDCGEDIDTYMPSNADNMVGVKVKGFGFDLPVKRSEIVDKSKDILLDDGSLVIDAELQIVSNQDEYRPLNPHVKNMLALLDSGDDSDASFKIGGTVIHAHKLILKNNAPILFGFCEKNENGKPIPITETNLDVFRIVLQYVYGGETPDANTLKELGKDIIEAANCFGVINLKLAVETALVELLVITMRNVVDWLLFADAKTCPLLKEYATSFFVTRAVDLLSLESSTKLKEAPELYEELMIAIAKDRDMYKEKANNKVGSRTSMRGNDKPLFLFHHPSSVGELRRKLDERGMDVDGSKEILISRLMEQGPTSNKRLKAG